MSDGPTTVDEFLAQGGTITRERPDVPEVVTVDGVRLSFVRDSTTSAEYRCEVTGVYGYRNPMGHLKPMICTAPRCKRHGTVQQDAAFWCDEHGGGE